MARDAATHYKQSFTPHATQAPDPVEPRFLPVATRRMYTLGFDRPMTFHDKPLTMEVLKQSPNPLISLRRHPSKGAQIMDRRGGLTSRASFVEFMQNDERHKLVTPESSPPPPVWSVRTLSQQPKSRGQ